MSKIWKIRGKEEKISDAELIAMIKEGRISKDDYISNSDMKSYMKIEDTIYQYYLRKDDKDETL